MGCDGNGLKSMFGAIKFQSTHPSWGATFASSTSYSEFALFQSTHPSWGATKRYASRAFRDTDFNPRTHRGVRQMYNRSIMMSLIFQSTHPSWGATKLVKKEGKYVKISIHAPIVGCDKAMAELSKEETISIHAPIVGCDIQMFGLLYYARVISIHAPIVGCDSY